jgi:hypothetical protein
MERAGIARIDEDTDRCLHLCWKGMYIDSVWDPDVQHGNDRLFWCHKTMKPVGADNQAVDEYDCNETRSCYEAF